MAEVNDQNEKSIYEVGYHIVPNIDETEVLTHVSKIKSLIEEKEGVILSEEMPKMMNIAYDISKNINSKKQNFNKTHFAWIKFEMDRSRIMRLKNEIKDLQNILRFLIIKTVRGDTMHIPKQQIFRKEKNKEGKINGHLEKAKTSEAEIDKGIEQLIISQTL